MAGHQTQWNLRMSFPIRWCAAPQRASNTATVTFPDVEVPLDHRIGGENDGFKIAMATLDRTRPNIAAMATGVARAAFEFAVQYAQERVQFGVPIAMHQAIQFMIADMATEIEAARLLVWKSAVQLDHGERNTLLSSHAKRFAGDVAMKVATDAVQVYGGCVSPSGSPGRRSGRWCLRRERRRPAVRIGGRSPRGGSAQPC